MKNKPLGWKILYFLSHFILISVILLYAFKSLIMPYYLQFKFRSPVEFYNTRISFPKHIIFNKGENSIVFNHWENPKAYLHIGKINLSKISKDYLLQAFEKKNFIILETKDAYFKGYEGFTISYIDASWMYNKAIFVIPKNLRIIYQGTKEDYSAFKGIIDTIEFL